MSLYDEYTTDYTNDFPQPDEVKEFWPPEVELEPGVRESAKADCNTWTLLDLRGNGGFKDKNDGLKIVINVRAQGTSDEYPHSGEVAYWLEERHVSNPKHPQRRHAAMLGQMFKGLGLIPADAEANTAKELLEQLVAAASKPTPQGASFNGMLVWEKRAYIGGNGEKYHSRDHMFVNIKKVALGGAADDLPY